MKKKAFTLIELLVVIAIIGLLATLSVIALNNARAKSRDAKRVADVKQMQTALELYFNDVQSYPDTVTAGGTIQSTSTNGTTTYMQIVPAPPTPPTGITEYTYGLTTGFGGGSYTLEYCLEGPVGGISGGTADTENNCTIYTATNAALYQ